MYILLDLGVGRYLSGLLYHDGIQVTTLSKDNKSVILRVPLRDSLHLQEPDTGFFTWFTLLDGTLKEAQNWRVSSLL